jgi:hypothetical protein
MAEYPPMEALAPAWAVEVQVVQYGSPQGISRAQESSQQTAGVLQPLERAAVVAVVSRLRHRPARMVLQELFPPLAAVVSVAVVREVYTRGLAPKTSAKFLSTMAE